MGHGGNVIAELMTDHREVEELFGRIQALPLRDERRGPLVEQVTIELVRHSVAEEMYLYPAVREHVRDGDALADKEIEDHGKVEGMLKDLENIPVGDERYDSVVDRLVSEVGAHVADEEQNLFPALAGACSSQTLDTLGDQVRRAKKIAPTRPHPSAPDNPRATSSSHLAPDWSTGPET